MRKMLGRGLRWVLERVDAAPESVGPYPELDFTGGVLAAPVNVVSLRSYDAYSHVTGPHLAHPGDGFVEVVLDPSQATEGDSLDVE